MDEQEFDREPVWDNITGQPLKPTLPLASQARKSWLSYITMFILLILWPAASVVGVGDPAETLKLLSTSRIMFIYLPTIIIQWVLFAIIWLTLYTENTGLKDIGFNRLKPIYLFWAIAFLLASNLILTFLALLLEYFGIMMVGEITLMLPSDATERIFWIILSITAGVCEEVAFRGYLITRLQLFGKTSKWLIPSIIASIVFGMGHAYQGLGGFILLTVYGGLFALLYWRTNSIWPPIIAHFLQDLFSGLFYPQ